MSVRSGGRQYSEDRKYVFAEVQALREMRERCKESLAEQVAFPEVVGDRRLLRFLHGRSGNIEEACKQYEGFLKWRKVENVDQIRQNIVYGEVPGEPMNDPMKWPNGAKLLGLAPQIIIAPVKDKNGFPIVTEQYNFSPKRLFQESSLEEYLEFLIYALEFRNLVLEHMSHEADREYVNKFPNVEDRADGWGCILRNCTIRDLGALRWEHIGPDGRAFIKAAIQLGSRTSFRLFLYMHSSRFPACVRIHSSFLNLTILSVVLCIIHAPSPNSQLSRVAWQGAHDKHAVVFQYAVDVYQGHAGSKVSHV